MQNEDYSLYNVENIQLAKTDRDYLGRLIMANEELIWFTIHKYVGNVDMLIKYNNIEKKDLLQVGRLGFIVAVDTYDPSKGSQFPSYAITGIMREVRCFLRDKGRVLKLTRSAFTLYNKVQNYLKDYDDADIPVDQIIQELNIKESELKKVLTVGLPPLELDNNIAGNLTFKDVLVDEKCDIELEIIDKLYVDKLLKTIQFKLGKVDISVLEKRLQGMTQTQIAESEDISKMRVNRILKKVAKLIEAEINQKN